VFGELPKLVRDLNLVGLTFATVKMSLCSIVVGYIVNKLEDFDKNFLNIIIKVRGCKMTLSS
jgi:hypothetical protein